ncbi:CBS domain containing-hemolysin-like protein [Aminivibrio pyruvatiphilus]|uniref:CBS domain containing-hemolysin-like protein n=1 Tax=Aminivibrio pyruvatiphilus TaxID=1005740 RepID=A0A4R8M5U5_9BACT|nr:hemolysin family protein [Aminivibrio pyruvatiphilus]TDY58321.1 CBS domain containing-hemolysin-like protein [Aminivibrio pyruvatiphilus]
MNVLLTESVLLLILLLVLSAFFSASETAITSSGRGKILALMERYPYQKRFFDWLLRDIQRALTIVLISNNLVNIAASAVATSLAIMLLGQGGLIVSVGVMTVLIVVFGEIFPKSVAIVRSDSILAFSLPLLRLLDILLAPFLWIMVHIVRGLGVIFKVDLKARHPFVTREEFEQMVNIGEESGALEEVERKMIHGIISFEETRVYEIMVPRTDMDAVSSEATVSEAMKIFQEHGHSRVPVYDESPDDIVGILYVKDTIPSLLAGNLSVPVSSIMRQALFVPESMRVVELFNTMKGRHVHMAIVVDEYGGVAGIATLEDLLEEIVGEIQDEYDKEKPTLLPEDDGSWLVQGHLGLEDLSDFLGSSFESEDAESLGGLVLSISGDFPSPGETVHYRSHSDGKVWEIEVLEVEDHRIKLLRLRPKEKGFFFPEGGE